MSRPAGRSDGVRPSGDVAATPARPRRLRLALATSGAVAALLLAGCGPLGYYAQSVGGHLAILHAARPVPEVLQDATLSEGLRRKLTLAQYIRRYASDRLALPDNRSYTAYADLHRGAAVWNVVAAPAYSLQLKTWCYPVAGCVGYRGYYDEAEAQAEAARQRAEGLEAAVYPVPAYSTLGWLNWLGGDPLLSTFIGYPDGELARIVFHELAHQRFYVSGDTVFNESYATAVERLGSAQWLRDEADAPAREAYTRFDQRRRQMQALMLATREALARAYGSPAAKAGDWAQVEAMKQAAMREFREHYAQLRAGWPADGRQGAYDAWVARANNATFGAQAAYDQLVPQFERLFARYDGDWARFHAEVERIGRLPTHEARVAALDSAPSP